jgi:hypothetical protein
MNLEKRIRLLEEITEDLAFPEMSVKLFVTDGRRDPPDHEPDRLAMVIRAGTPRGGKVYHRMPDESEQDFIERSGQ